MGLKEYPTMHKESTGPVDNLRLSAGYPIDFKGNR
jgi:hypothetical protein